MLTDHLTFHTGLVRRHFLFDPDRIASCVLKEMPALFSGKDGCGRIFKESGSCFAAERVFSVFPVPVFYKRNPNKGVKYTFRYLFREPRLFHAARISEFVRAAGIETPEVWFCGSLRIGLLLLCACSVAEYLEGMKPVASFVKKAESAEEAILWTVRSAVLLKSLHQAGIYHGDFKMQNLYWHHDKIGILDLDGAKKYQNEVPTERRFRDVVRLIVSAVHERYNDFSLIPVFTERVLQEYGEFTVSETADGVREFFRRSPPT